MDEPPDFDFMEDEDDFEEQCREELQQMADQELAMELEPDGFEEEKNETSSFAVPASDPAPPDQGLYSSPHKMYQSPEVFKQLNNDFSKNRR